MLLCSLTADAHRPALFGKSNTNTLQQQIQQHNHSNLFLSGFLPLLHWICFVAIRHWMALHAPSLFIIGLTDPGEAMMSERDQPTSQIQPTRTTKF